MRRLQAPIVIALGAALLWLLFDGGFVNYDTLYALLWGADLGSGRMPEFSLPLAPTPHPLANLLGLLLTPLQAEAAEQITMVLAFVALAALVYVLYQLTSEAFGLIAGLAAAAILLTREPVLSFGIRAYIDVPYVLFLLCALLVESRRRRAGWPVLALIGLAGLLRPEAWLFASAYLIYVLPSRSLRERIGLAALAATAPLIWVLSDWAITGDLLFSLNQTETSAETLERVRGIEHVPLTGPRRVGEIVREPVLVGGVGGLLLALLWLRTSRARLLATAGLVSLGAFIVLAIPGLPIITRYLLLPAVILIAFCGAGLGGWLLGPGDRRRQVWIASAAVTAALLIAFTPSQAERLSKLHAAIETQHEIRNDLESLVRDSDLSSRCGPISVPNHRAVPLVAFWLDRPPISIQTDREPSYGYVFLPTSMRVARNFILDKHDPSGGISLTAPGGFTQIAENASWRLYRHC